MVKGRRIDINKILASLKRAEELDLEDWLLSLLYASPEKSLRSEKHLQKALFLASKYIDRLREEVEFKLSLIHI